MKFKYETPPHPEYSPADTEKAWKYADTKNVIDAVFKYNKKYLHWEELRWRELPVDPPLCLDTDEDLQREGYEIHNVR